MSKPSPMLLGALALGGFFLYRRAQAQRVAITGVSAKTTADYANPMQWAGLLAGAVVNMTKGIKTEIPAGVFAVKHPIIAGTPESGLAGWDKFTSSVAGSGSVSGDPYNDGTQASMWAGPSTASANVASATQYGTSVDQVVAAPIYDLRTDFVNNPFGLAAP